MKIGLVPELASSLFLPLRCGWGAASDLTLSGRTLEAADAHALVNPSPQARWIKELLTQNVNESDTRAAQPTFR